MKKKRLPTYIILESRRTEENEVKRRNKRNSVMWYSALAVAAIYVFGLWWCYQVMTRFRQDLREIFELKEITRTAVIIFIWIITILIILALILSGFVLIKRFIWFIGTF